MDSMGERPLVPHLWLNPLAPSVFQCNSHLDARANLSSEKDNFQDLAFCKEIYRLRVVRTFSNRVFNARDVPR